VYRIAVRVAACTGFSREGHGVGLRTAAAAAAAGASAEVAEALAAAAAATLVAAPPKVLEALAGGWRASPSPAALRHGLGVAADPAGLGGRHRQLLRRNTSLGCEWVSGAAVRQLAVFQRVGP
jgi:hypothetical protein